MVTLSFEENLAEILEGSRSGSLLIARAILRQDLEPRMMGGGRMFLRAIEGGVVGFLGKAATAVLELVEVGGVGENQGYGDRFRICIQFRVQTTERARGGLPFMTDFLGRRADGGAGKGFAPFPSASHAKELGSRGGV